MTIGLVPVGGNATRLGLPYSKCMLPQKGFNYYNPVANHCVHNLLETGVKAIIFGHGTSFKEDILNYYHSDRFIHVLEDDGPSDGGNRFINFAIQKYAAKDYIFCLPDTITTAQDYKVLLQDDSMVCGLYDIPDEIRGDRLDHYNKFDVKSYKTVENKSLCWGTIKFLRNDILKNPINCEIGSWLNQYYFSTCVLGKMIDIGTWTGYNYYLNIF